MPCVCPYVCEGIITLASGGIMAAGVILGGGWFYWFALRIINWLTALIKLFICIAYY